MDIKQLRYFNEIARFGSIAKAAEKIYISPQGLSMALMRLESDLSCRLFERTSGGLSLTPQGEFLLSHSQDIVEQFDAIEGYFKEIDRERVSVRIACSLGAMPEYMANILLAFEAEHLKYQIDVREGSDKFCDSLVESRNVDLGFGIAPFNNETIKCMPLFSSPFCLLVNRNHELAEMRSVPLKILKENPVMIMDQDSKTFLLISRKCKELGFKLSVRYYAAEVIAIHRMVAANVGIGVSVLSVAQSIPNNDVIAIPFDEPELKWELNMTKRKNAVLSAGARAFERFVTDAVKKNKIHGYMPGSFPI